MIQSYEGLAEVRELLARMEGVVISWHRDLWDTNRRNYYLYADGAIEMMLRLRAEMDEFLGIKDWRPDDDAPLNGAPAEKAAGEPATS